MSAVIIRGDARHLPLADASVDAIVTDPPYALTELSTARVLEAISAWMRGDRMFVPGGRGFMGRDWDRFVPPPGAWDECLRVLKPGGWLLAFAGSRTVDLMGLSIRIAGFEIRDSIDWIYGSGFPKSLDVSKAIDKAAGATREVVGMVPPSVGGGRSTANDGWRRPWMDDEGARDKTREITAPATDDARRWSGFGTALKPGHEPIVVARKPLAGTVAANVLTHGTGALNIDACRIEHGADVDLTAVQRQQHRHDGDKNWRLRPRHEQAMYSPAGRWPTNLVFTHSAACNDGPCAPDCPVAELDRQSGITPSNARANKGRGLGYHGGNGERGAYTLADAGGASRFFPTFRYEAKASSSERPRGEDGTAHVTVKPLALMRWLVRLVTPPGGVCLDPFLGSGTTAEACLIEGFRCVGVELDEAHLPLIKARLTKPIQPTLEVG